VYSLSQKSGTPVEDIIEINGLDDNAKIKVGDQLRIPGLNQIGASPATSGATRGIDPKDNYSPQDFDRLVNQGQYESQIDNEFEEMMGQFGESKDTDVEEGETAVEEQKTPVTEFVLSMFDRETGQFPKGETAILTAIEKDYGEQYINPAKAFIEAINAKFEEFNAGPAIQEIEFDELTAGTMMEPTVEQDDELNSIRRLSGI
jgi:hypothetical protein